jgi:hypothetical protein
LDKTSRTADDVIFRATGKMKTTYGINTTQYIPPEKISCEINTKLRAEKDDDQEAWDALLA